MIKNWIEDNLLDVQWIDDNVFEIINIGRFLVVSEKDIVFDQEMDLILDHGEESIDIDFYCFKFGEQYYYTDSIKIKKLKPLKYLGKYRDELQISNPPFLGIHGGYELLNGSRIYIDWIQKAKFLDINTLGIVEKNTLAGVLKFQLACQDNNITPIIGEQVVVKDGDDLLQFKCYVKNEIGWKNLLTINKIINIVNHGFILRGDFLNLVEGISVVVDCKYTPYNKIRTYHSTISDLYYQIDSVEFKNNEKDQEYLLNLQKFVKQKDIKPVLISDAYYLDKEDSDAKTILNNISNVRDFKSEDQYFKTIEDNYSSLSSLFSDENEFIEVFGDALNNVIELSKECVFQIQTDIKYLPEYLMTDEEVEKYGDKETMFWALVEEGLKNKIKDDDLDKYLDRINEEYDTISLVQSEFGNGVDYFLISQDIVKYCNENNILVGLGRGSAAGSFLAYLLDITKINPFDYDLLFSRFLNKGRVEKGTYPDFDIDFQALRRNEVKKYLEDKYGHDNVCSIGTYTTLQLKAAFKDVARQRNVDYATANYISEGIDIDRGEWTDLFNLALQKRTLKNFIDNNPGIIEDLKLILKQPKSASIHACAMVVTPKNKSIYEYLPVRLGERNGEEMIVSEWEGEELEKAGFLKEDILGIKQLDKYAFILNLIKEQTGDEVDLYNVPLDVEGVYDLFKQGDNGDIFHFGSTGLTGYCKDLRPDSIHELITGIALYRPGPIEINSHNEYVLRKDGDRSVTYRWGTDKILESTYGLIVYQEQVMKIVSELADFTLVEADEIRRAMGKKKDDVIDRYGEQFIRKAIEKGCPEEEAKAIWHELEVQSKYVFNKCISGDERFLRMKGGNSFEPTISEMYKICNDRDYAKKINKVSLHGRYKRSGYGCCFSMNEKMRLVKNNIKDIRYVGKRDCYKVLLENGEFIRVTNNHKFPTSNGEKQLKNIDIDSDFIYFNDGYELSDTMYRFSDKGELNDVRYHNNDNVYKYELNSVKGKEGFQKKSTPFTQLQDYIKNHKKNKCEKCGGDKCRLEVHHKDGNHSNNELSNLTTLCASCHKKEHYKMGRTKIGEKGFLTKLVKIKEIIYIGKTDVYDVEMDKPYHSFTIKNGIVTSNSHASSYAITGYIGQWLKYHYPLQYWTSAFQFDDPNPKKSNLGRYISEIRRTDNFIKIMPPEINESGETFTSNYEKMELYWSITRVKQLGEKALQSIMEERNKNGEFFSLEDFLNRTEKRVVNKAVVINLILSGSFDAIENIKIERDRKILINKYYDFSGTKRDKEDEFLLDHPNYWWQIKQKEICGFGDIDYKTVITENTKLLGDYCEGYQIKDLSENKKIIVAGMIKDFTIKTTKKDDEYCKLVLDCNNEDVDIMVWNESYRNISEEEFQTGRIFIMFGSIAEYRGNKSVHSYEESEIYFLN